MTTPLVTTLLTTPSGTRPPPGGRRGTLGPSQANPPREIPHVKQYILWPTRTNPTRSGVRHEGGFSWSDLGETWPNMHSVMWESDNSSPNGTSAERLWASGYGFSLKSSKRLSLVGRGHEATKLAQPDAGNEHRDHDGFRRNMCGGGSWIPIKLVTGRLFKGAGDGAAANNEHTCSDICGLQTILGIFGLK